MSSHPDPVEITDFKVLFESAPSLYLVLNPQFIIVAVSDAYLQATMTERERILGRHIFDVFPDNPNDPTATGVKNLRDSLERVLKHGTADTMAVQKYDIRKPAREGEEEIFEERYWSPVNSPVFKKGTREIAYIVHRAEDVTRYINQISQSTEKSKQLENDIVLRGQELQESNKRLREAENELRKAHAELELRVEERTRDLRQAQQALIQQERLLALGKMASGIAHDFNNTLSPILGYSEMLLDGTSLNDKELAASYLKMINMAARDAVNIVNRLSHFGKSRKTDEQFGVVDLNRVVDQTVVLTQPKWKTQAMTRGVEVSLETELNDVPVVTGNEHQLREAFINLIFNAVDALEQSGTITLRTYSSDGHAVLEIRDTGRGMSEEVRQKCLEPFFTTKGEHGTGLGLSMVYGIVQQHAGKMEIQSEEGLGTIFIIYLPAGQDRGAQTSSQPPQTRVKPLRILYVEDEPTVRAVITECLKRCGHDVEAFANGAEGLAHFCAVQGPYDLVIADATMPQMNGIQMAAEIRKISPEQKIILLSGTTDFESRENLQIFNAILKKPVSLEELRRTLSSLFPLSK